MNRFLIVLAVLIMGCASDNTGARRFASLREGMTKQELVSLLGQPRTVSHQGALSVYEYGFTQGAPGGSSYYVIVGEDGRVRSFGRN